MKTSELKKEITALREKVQEMEKNNISPRDGGRCPRKGHKDTWTSGSPTICGVCGREYEGISFERTGVTMQGAGIITYTRINGIHP